MNVIFFFLLAAITVILSIKISHYADSLSKSSKKMGFIISGLLLAAITSLPELVTTLTAVKMNNPHLAIGDVLGSNIFNLFMMAVIDIFIIKEFIFSKVSKNYFYEYLAMIVCYLSIFFLSDNSSFGSIGIPTILLFLSYAFYIAKISKTKNTIVQDEKPKKGIITKMIICAILLIASSIFLTKIVNVISLEYPRVSGSIIGAILLGITTSLPEVITFITLIKLKNYNMALTDILGSNIFNLFVLGISDLLIKNNPIYIFMDSDSLFLIKIALVITSLSFIQSLKKQTKYKLFYIIPSVLIVGVYIYFWIIGVVK
ncbi:MAG TPA: hypothetical protein PLT65_00150 [Bacilli bacterium]|nr:hypothetical protein [Bacilli bacterium]